MEEFNKTTGGSEKPKEEAGEKDIDLEERERKNREMNNAGKIKEVVLNELKSKIKELGINDLHSLIRSINDNLDEQIIGERYDEEILRRLIKENIDFEKVKILTIKEVKEVIKSVYKEKAGEEKADEQKDITANRAKIENTLGEWMKKKTALRIEEGGEEKYILTVCTPGAEIEYVWVGTKEGEKAEAERLKKEEIYKLNAGKIGEGEKVAEKGKDEAKKEKEENLETKVVKVKKELFENAGNKSKEELVQLISDVEKILDEEKEKGKGKLKDKISEIRDSEFGKEKFTDDSIVYLPKDGEAVFIGDTHGDPDAAVSIIEQEKFIEAMESGEKNKYLVFLGDYVDRGKSDVENIEQVIALYKKYPDNVILLRGNHEGKETTDNDFLISLLRKYGDKKLAESLGKYETPETTDNVVKELYERYNKLFEKLPGVVVCGNGIVGVHGGIPNEDIKSLKDLNDPNKLYQMRWNDPYEGKEERCPSGRGEGITIFNEDAFGEFMKAVNGKVMARAHEYGREKLMFDNKLATIFSNGKGGEKSHYRYEIPVYAKFDLSKEIDKITVDNIKKMEYIKPNYKLETEKPKGEIKETAAWVNIRTVYRNKSKDIEARHKKASAEDKKKIEDYLKSDVLDSSVLEKYDLDLNEENKKKALEIQKEVYRELLDKLKPNQIPIPKSGQEKPEQKKAPRTLDELFDKLGEDGEKLREILARFEKNLKTDNERFAEIATSEDVKRIEKKIENSEPLTKEEIDTMVKMERTKQIVLGDRINASTAESTAFYLASGDKDIKGMLELRVRASESILKQYEQYFASRRKEEDFKQKEMPENYKAAKKLSKATGEKTKGFWGKIGEKLDVWTEAKIIPHEEWVELGNKLNSVKDEKGLEEAIGFLREKTKDKKIPERFPEEVKDVLEKTQAIINSTDRKEGIQWYLSAIEDGDIRNNNDFTEALKKDRELIGKAPRGACKNSLNKLLDKIEEIWKLKIGTDQKLDKLEKITAEISGTGEAESKPEGKSQEKSTAGTTTLYDWAMEKYRDARKTIAESSIARATGISKAIYEGDYKSFKKKRETVEEEKKAYRQAKTPKARYDEILDGAWKGRSDTEFAAIMEVMIEKKELTIDEMSKHLSSKEIRSLEKSISDALMRRKFAFDVDELKKSMPQLASQVELKPEDSQNEVDKKTMEYTKEIVSEEKLASLNRAAMEDPIVINTIRKEHNDFDLWVKGRSETDKQSIKRGLEGMLLILDGKIRVAGRGDIANITGSENEKIVSVAGAEMTKNELREEISNIKKSLANSDKNGHNMLNNPATDRSGEIALNKEGRIDFENGTINEKARKEFAESMKSGKDTYRNRTTEFYEAMGRYFSKEQFNQVKKHCSVEQMKAAKKSALMAPAGSVSQEILDFLETDSGYKFLKIEENIINGKKEEHLKIFKEKENNIEKVIDLYDTSKWTQQTFNQFRDVADDINDKITSAFGTINSDYLYPFLVVCNDVVVPLFREARAGRKINVAEELEKMESGYKSATGMLTKTERDLPLKIKEFYKAYFNKLNELADLEKGSGKKSEEKGEKFTEQEKNETSLLFYDNNIKKVKDAKDFKELTREIEERILVVSSKTHNKLLAETYSIALKNLDNILAKNKKASYRSFEIDKFKNQFANYYPEYYNYNAKKYIEAFFDKLKELNEKG